MVANLIRPLKAYMDHFDIRSHIQFVGNPIPDQESLPN